MADEVATPSVPKPTPEYVAAARRGHAKKTPAVSGPPTVGVVFNGGGNRALCGAYGVLRGLQQLKVDGVSALDRIDVMCGNSGGFWATTIFSFACESDHSNETLLEACRSPDPTLVTNAELERLGPKTLGHAATRPTCWQLLCCGPFALVGWLTGPWGPLCLLRGVGLSCGLHDFWSWIVYSTYLKPYGIPRGKFFTTDRAEATRLADCDPTGKLHATDFVWPREEVHATPCAAMSMVGPADGKREFEAQAAAMKSQLQCEYDSNGEFDAPAARRDHNGVSPVPYFATPAAVGTRYETNTMTFGTRVFSPPDCGATPPDLVVSPRTVPPYEWVLPPSLCDRFSTSHGRFGIETAAAISSDAFQSFPCFESVSVRLKVGAPPGRVLAFGDGAVVEGTGICTALLQGVSRVIAVINPESPGSPVVSVPYSAIAGKCLEDWTAGLDPRLASLFGVLPKEANGCAQKCLAEKTIGPAFGLNHVFCRSKLAELKRKMDALYLAGRALVVTLELDLLPNVFWGFEGGRTIRLTLIYYNMPRNFAEQLPGDVSGGVTPAGNGDVPDRAQLLAPGLSDVPELKIQLEPPGYTHYTKRQVNMMGYLGAWIVEDGREEICAAILS